MLGKLSWAAIPLDQPIPLFAAAFVGAVLFCVMAYVTLKGWLPYLWREWITSVDHKRIGIMYVRPGDGDAAAWLLRRDHDAVAAGAGVPVRRLSAAGALRSDILGARHVDDLLRRDAVRHRVDELRHAAAAWRSRRGVSDPQFGQLLADRDRRAADQHLTGRRGVRAYRMAALSAAVRTHLFARRRRRLLPLGVADFRRRHLADRASISSPRS